MGCAASIRKSSVLQSESEDSWHSRIDKNETVVATLVRLDRGIASCEKRYPTQRLAIVTAELKSIQLEIQELGGVINSDVTEKAYAKAIHQIFVELHLYKRPMLAAENEDFVANVNRKEMHRLEVLYLSLRQKELQRESQILQTQLLRLRSLYREQQHLLESLWYEKPSSEPTPQSNLRHAQGLRDALATASMRLRAGAEYTQNGLRLLEEALRSWKLSSIGSRSGWERTSSCAEACSLLVKARCQERGARRVLGAQAAPRAARSVRLTLDYAFTDCLHDHKNRKATETFIQFKETLGKLYTSINKFNMTYKSQEKCLVCSKQQNVNMLKCFRNILTYRNNAVFKSQIRYNSEEIPIFINGKSVCVPKYYTVMQALRQERVTIPSFCYHERLSIAGNCRMCLVEIEGMWKPQIACALPVSKNIKIWTNSKLTLRAQESVLEFILVDHPLDCPICDQGGECDLQDLTMKFGNDRTRFTDIHFQGKRAVEDKNLGPLIRTEMTRCIHCTRCIRFASQVAGMDVLGTAGRGGEMLVGTYVDKMFLSEVSGNIIDLCPVGSLTAIPYMFKARPWEIRRTNSIDATDATGTNIVLNHRFNRVIRVLPRENEEINQEWLSDKGRWSIDSLEMQRLVSPMYRNQGRLVPIEWDCALKLTASTIKNVNPGKIMAIAGPYCNAETLVVAKDYLNILGCENTYVEKDLTHINGNIDLRTSYSINIKMNEIAKADRILLVGTNPRFEAPILNTWIRLAYTHNDCDIFAIGPQCDYNYHVNYIGQDTGSLSQAAECLKGAKNPLIFVGIDQLDSPNAGQIMAALYNLAGSFKVDKEWGIVNIVTRDAGFAAALEAGWKPGALNAMKTICPCVIISLGADDIFYKIKPSIELKIIYVGFQGDKGSEFASLILPGSAYTESGGVFLNMECRSQFALPAITPPGKARYDWKIFRALAEYSGISLFYSDADTLCCRLAQISPNFVNFDYYQHKLFSELIPRLIKPGQGGGGNLNVPMKEIKDYYCSNIYTCNSNTMRQAEKAAKLHKKSNYACI